MRMGGGIVNFEISQVNEYIDDAGTYCLAEKPSADHVIWTCSHFHATRDKHDPLLVKVPTKYLSLVPGEGLHQVCSRWGQVILGPTPW